MKSLPLVLGGGGYLNSPYAERRSPAVRQRTDEGGEDAPDVEDVWHPLDGLDDPEFACAIDATFRG